jgi:hypothetical protein
VPIQRPWSYREVAFNEPADLLRSIGFEQATRAAESPKKGTGGSGSTEKDHRLPSLESKRDLRGRARGFYPACNHHIAGEHVDSVSRVPEAGEDGDINIRPGTLGCRENA